MPPCPGEGLLRKPTLAAYPTLATVDRTFGWEGAEQANFPADYRTGEKKADLPTKAAGRVTAINFIAPARRRSLACASGLDSELSSTCAPDGWFGRDDEGYT